MFDASDVNLQSMDRLSPKLGLFLMAGGTTI